MDVQYTFGYKFLTALIHKNGYTKLVESLCFHLYFCVNINLSIKYPAFFSQTVLRSKPATPSDHCASIAEFRFRRRMTRLWVFFSEISLDEQFCCLAPIVRKIYFVAIRTKMEFGSNNWNICTMFICHLIVRMVFTRRWLANMSYIFQNSVVNLMNTLFSNSFQKIYFLCTR